MVYKRRREALAASILHYSGPLLGDFLTSVLHLQHVRSHLTQCALVLS